MLIRRDAWSLVEEAQQGGDPIGWHPVLLAYAKAIRVLKSRDAATPPDFTSFRHQAARHEAADGVLPGNAFQQCQHHSWHFLPWHRLHLFYFEQILISTMGLKEVDGPDDFALPYWNYGKGPQKNATLPLPFREPTLPDGSANPLFEPSRNAGLNTGSALPPQSTTPAAALLVPSFAATNTAGFGGGDPARDHFGVDTGALEQTPHNDVHVGVGGLMLGFDSAPLDPIFWLHHANLDRLWNVWLEKGTVPASPAYKNPPDTAWRDEPFEFFDKDNQLETKAPKQVERSAPQLDYRYDDDQGGANMPVPGAGGAAEPEAAATPTPQPPRLVGASEGSLVLTGERASVQVVVPREEAATAEAAGGGSRLIVTVDDITADRTPGLIYGVYLGQTGGDAEKVHIGNLSLFGIERWNDLDRAGHGGVGFRLRYDVTDVVAEMRARGVWDAGAVDVTFEPLRLIPPPDAEATPEAAGATPEAEQTPIGIGRVSLFLS